MTSFVAATLPDGGGEGPPRLPGEWLRIRGATSIGWPSDETAVIVTGGDPTGVAGSVAAADASGIRPLVPTGRPSDDRLPERSGVVALRWFELAAADWDEFLDLSVSAWPAFEESFDAAILGLFRASDVDAPDVDAPDATALLVTRYASLAVWEESRSVLAARSGSLAHSGRRFLRRHEITRRSVVRVGRPS